MNKDGVLDNKELFEMARKLYPGTKVGLDTEFNNLKKHKDWKEIIPLLCSAILYQTKVRAWLKGNNSFVPPWKHLRTWTNNRCWEMEFPDYDAAQTPKKTPTMPQDAKSVANSPDCTPEIKISTPEERRKIAEEYDWRIK